MAQDTMSRQQHIAGLQAYKSATEQAIAGATKAADLFPDSELRQLAVRVIATITKHHQTLLGFLAAVGAEGDAPQNKLLESINQLTDLTAKAAQDDGALNVALLTGGKVALNYFVTAFRGHIDTATALGLAEQAAAFRQMAGEQEALNDQYAEIALVRIFPQVAQAQARKLAGGHPIFPSAAPTRVASPDYVPSESSPARG